MVQAQALGGGGGGAGVGGQACCRLRTAGLLGWTFGGIGTCCVNVVVLHIVVPLIPIKRVLSIRVKKILRTIGYLCPCYETPEAMPNLLHKILLLNLSTGQHSWNTQSRGFMKPFDHIFVHFKNKRREGGI